MVNAKVSEKLRKLNGKGSWCFTGLLAVAALAPLARGQYGQEPQPDVPAFHSDAEEVSLTLVVHDKSNRPVPLRHRRGFAYCTVRQFGRPKGIRLG